MNDYTFGSIKVRITGSEDFTTVLKKQWKRYLQGPESKQIDAELELSLFPSIYSKTFADGWNTGVIEGQQINVFSRNGKPCFALQYQPAQKTVRVFVTRRTGNSSRLGTQFGLLTVLHQKIIGFHGVTLLCGNDIIILSAPSGTGKTTLGMLLEQYCDAIIINGDFALLNPTDEGVIFEPTPFCGTSGRSLNHRFRVNRIVFLGQKKENVWRTLDGREAMTRFMSNAFVPTWDADMQQAIQDNILKCISMVKVNAYDFAPTQEAAEVFLKHAQKNA